MEAASKQFGGNLKVKATMLTLQSNEGGQGAKKGSMVSIATTSLGMTMLYLANPEKKTGVFLAMLPDGTPQIHLMGKDGKSRTIVPE